MIDQKKASLVLLGASLVIVVGATTMVDYNTQLKNQPGFTVPAGSSISAAVSSAAKGSSLTLPAGVYSSPGFTLSGVSLTCQPGAIISFTSGNLGITISGTAQTNIKGPCKFQSAGGATSGFINITAGTQNVVVDGPTFTQSGNYAFYLSGTDGSLVQHVYLRNLVFTTGTVADTVFIQGVNDVEISHPTFQACGSGGSGDCISIDNAASGHGNTNVRIVEPMILGYSRIAIEANGAPPMSQITVDGGIILTGGSGTASQSISISGVTGGHANSFFTDSKPEIFASKDFEATGFTVKTTGADGFWLEESTNVTISGFTIDGPSAHGILMGQSDTVNTGLYGHFDRNTIGPGTIVTTGSGVGIWAQCNNSATGASCDNDTIVGVNMTGTNSGAYGLKIENDYNTATMGGWNVHGNTFKNYTDGYIAAGAFGGIGYGGPSVFFGNTFDNISIPYSVGAYPGYSLFVFEPGQTVNPIYFPALAMNGKNTIQTNSTVNTDLAGEVVLGGAGTYTLTYPTGHTYTKELVCTANGYDTTSAIQVTPGGSAVTFTAALGAGAAGKVVFYICIAQKY